MFTRRAAPVGEQLRQRIRARRGKNIRRLSVVTELLSVPEIPVVQASPERRLCRHLKCPELLDTHAGSDPWSRRGEAPVSRKPSIFQVGKVRDDGRTVVISGWGLGLCASGCACHRHPTAGHLSIAEDQAGGLLGLASYRAGGCDCCEPWSADELAAILRDLDTVTGLEAQEPLAG